MRITCFFACVSAFVAIEQCAAFAAPAIDRAGGTRGGSTFASAPRAKLLSPVLYVSDTYQNVVTVYDLNQGKNYPIYGHIALPNRPEGVTTDSSSNLYVTQPNGVLVYNPGTYTDVKGVVTVSLPTAPASTLVDTNNPTDVAVGPDGEVYVANQGGPQSSSGGSVSVFARGTTTAAYTVPFGTGTYVDGVTLDAANNLYIAWRDATGTAYINTSPAPAVGTQRTTGSDMASIIGDIFRGVQYDDKDAAIVYADYVKPEIWTSPEIKKDQPFDRLGTPDYIAFNTRKSQLFVPDLEHNLVEIYNYPSGGIHYLLNGIAGGAPAGCAVLPAPAL